MTEDDLQSKETNDDQEGSGLIHGGGGILSNEGVFAFFLL